RSFRRPTWPRYSLLDHKAFDRALAHQYGPDCRVEDCWRPFAAVATNLSTHNLELIRTGPLWQAVRASSAIPGLLPPFYTAEGAMLVDGCLIDNVPLASMHQLKSGPNLVVHFGEPAAEMFDVDYASLPGRFELIAAMLTPLPDGIDLTDFDRHTEIFETSYRWARDAIAALEAGGSSAIEAILDTGALERRQATAVTAANLAPGNRLASTAGLGALNR